MKKKEKDIVIDREGIDEASDTVRIWLEEIGTGQRDILRMRMIVEEILINICDHGPEGIQAVISFCRHTGSDLLRIRYGGDRFDPRKPADNEAEGFTAALLARTGILPVWRWRFGKNEVTVPVSPPKKSKELLMFGCIAAAVVTGLLGQYIPEPVRNNVADYGLAFLSGGFLNLLGTFIGLMIFLTVITGICGIGSAAALGRTGKQMLARFLTGTFVTSAVLTAGVSLSFSPANEPGGGASGFLSVLEMVFGIIPSNPVRPFLEGNTLQIVFLAVLTGSVLLLTGSQTEDLRKIISQAQLVVTRCVTAVCVFLPVYVFSSLVTQLWASGPMMLAGFWKPLVLGIVFSAALVGIYLAYTCRKLKVRMPVLVKKLLPDFLIGLSTSSSSAAFAAGMEINTEKLGIDRSFSDMAFPIGSILFSGSYSLLFIITGAYLAECYGIHADIAWWVTMWIVCTLLSIATPPVAGGNISCLTVMLAQLGIPAQGLAIGVALAMFLDFICTGARIPILHMELVLQADRMGLLDHDVLRDDRII